MAGLEVRRSLLLLLGGCALWLAIGCVVVGAEWSYVNPYCPSTFFNFGDSLTDTGSALNAFPFFTDFERPPYGQQFFGRVAKRTSNGRVVPDFFSNLRVDLLKQTDTYRNGPLEIWRQMTTSLAFNKNLLQPYLQSGAFDYRAGANFAFAGATASNDSTQAPVFLAFQVGQFLRFKVQTTSTTQQFTCAPFFFNLPQPSDFGNALYTIELGGNDLLDATLVNRIPDPTVVIPLALNAIVAAITQLYNNGGRHFLVFNVPPFGCSTIGITLTRAAGLPLDSLGCVIALNQLAQGYNAALAGTLAALRSNLPGADIALFRYYDANIEILTRPALYRFDPTKTLTACCGAPGVGTLNYNPAITCGATGSNLCSNPDEYVNWDGVHFTENFYRQIVKWALSAEFTDFGTNYTANCYLNFFNFPSTATYDSVYGNTCKVTFTGA